MLREVGSELGRRLYVAPATGLDAWTPELPESFLAFIALDRRERTDAELSDLARTLIDAGCVYSVTWGPQGSRMDLFMDLVWVETEAPGRRYVMTDDFHGDPLAEALWYAVYNTSSPDAEITALVAVVDAEFREQIERYLSDTDRLHEDFDVIYNAQVAAEESARRPSWFERLREKLGSCSYGAYPGATSERRSSRLAGVFEARRAHSAKHLQPSDLPSQPLPGDRGGGNRRGNRLEAWSRVRTRNPSSWVVMRRRTTLSRATEERQARRSQTRAFRREVGPSTRLPLPRSDAVLPEPHRAPGLALP